MKSEISPYTLDDLRKLPSNSVERLFARARYKEWQKKERQQNRLEIRRIMARRYKFRNPFKIVVHRTLVRIDGYVIKYVQYINKGRFREKYALETGKCKTKR